MSSRRKALVAVLVVVAVVVLAGIATAASAVVGPVLASRSGVVLTEAGTVVVPKCAALGPRTTVTLYIVESSTPRRFCVGLSPADLEAAVSLGEPPESDMPSDRLFGQNAVVGRYLALIRETETTVEFSPVLQVEDAVSMLGLELFGNQTRPSGRVR